MKRVDALWAAPTLLLLAGYLAYAVATLPTTAPTFDEVAHLPAGYVAVVTGRPLLNPEHPPLAKRIAAAFLPLLVPPDRRLEQAWSTLDEWSFGRLFLFHSGHDPQQLMAAGRLPLIVLGLLLCLVVYLWSRARNGQSGGFVSLLLCAFSPTILAHARLVTTDVPVAVFGTLAAFLGWRYGRRPRLRTALATGIFLGAAMATKFTGILFLASVGGAILLSLGLGRGLAVDPRGEGEKRRAGWTVAGHAVLALASAFLVVGLSYGGPFRIAPYLEGFAHVGFNHTPGYEFYLLGRFSEQGFAAYFPVALLLKSSPVLLTCLAAWVALRVLAYTFPAMIPRGTPVGVTKVSDWPFLALPAGLYFVFIVLEAPDIGVRYLIPVLPFLFVVAGGVGTALWRWPVGRVMVAGLAVWQGFVAASAWPDPISYFNGLAGCRDTGAIACLDDSNLDWGQDLVNVGRVVDPLRRPGETIRLLYFGTADPRAYVDHFRAMRLAEMASPRSELYVVSLHRLNRLIRETGVDWFSRYEPVAQVGRTALVYDFRALPVPGAHDVEKGGKTDRDPR